MLEKVGRQRALRQVPGTIPISHRYTLGVAGERFFKALRDDRQILASPCPRCRSLLLPARMYCERCFEETGDEWVALEGPAYVRSFTVLHYGLEEQPLDQPQVVAMITWPEAKGGLVHRVAGVDAGDVESGMAVEPVWGDERTGAWTDILHFRPAHWEI